MANEPKPHLKVVTSTDLQGLINMGIPVESAAFHTAVNNAFDVPETNLNEKSNVAGRRAKMWYTPSGLVCEQTNKETTRHFIVPLANVIFVHCK